MGRTTRSRVRAAALALLVAMSVTISPSPVRAQSREADERLIGALYELFLGREASDAEVGGWVSLLGHGATRSEVAGAIHRSTEGNRSIVRFIFEDALGRTPDAGALRLFGGLLDRGVRIDEVNAAVLGSPEYFRRAGGTNGAFVDALYELVLGRAADRAGRNHWLGRLAAGESREAVALAMGRSSEGIRSFVEFAYQFVLGREVDPGGLALWSGVLRFGADVDAVLVGLASSEEFFRTSQIPPPALVAGGPDWSPDGTRIAFMSDRHDDVEIHVMNADGTNVRRLTTSPGFDGEHAWSPDGTKIAFVSERSGNPDVWVMNADGTGVTQLTTHPEPDGLPAWSPDGARLSFASMRDGASHLFIMESTGVGQLRVPLQRAGEEFFSSWLSNTRIVVENDAGDGQVDLFAVDAAGGNVVRLTAAAGIDAKPDVSPDGTRIAFSSDRDGDPDIWVMAADGTGQRRVADLPGHDFWPSWAPDGTRLAFDSDAEHDLHVYVIGVDGSGRRRLA